jgi:hypothetical protein
MIPVPQRVFEESEASVDQIWELIAIQIKEEFDLVAEHWGPGLDVSVRYQKGFAFADDTVNVLVRTVGVKRV